MKPSQTAKSEIIIQVKDKFDGAKAVIVVDYRGLTVAQVSDLRRKLREVGADMVVAKNTLILRAMNEKVAREMASVFEGPTAVVFSADEVSAPKVLVAFNKTAGLPGLKGGLINDRVMTSEEIRALAMIPGREVLQGKLVGILAGQPTRLVWVLNGNIQKLVSIFGEIAKKKTN